MADVLTNQDLDKEDIKVREVVNLFATNRNRYGALENMNFDNGQFVFYNPAEYINFLKELCSENSVLYAYSEDHSYVVLITETQEIYFVDADQGMLVDINTLRPEEINHLMEEKGYFYDGETNKLQVHKTGHTYFSKLSSNDSEENTKEPTTAAYSL